MANIEDLWKTLEIKKGKNLGFEYSDSSFSPVEENTVNPFDENFDEDGSYDDPFDGEIGEFDEEVEVINRNGHVRREFSLSQYDVDVRPFQQYRNRVPVTLNTSSSEGQSSRDGRDSHDSIEEVDEEEYYLEMENDSYSRENHFSHGHQIYDGVDNLHLQDERYSNEGNSPSHVICDCEDCVIQRENTPVSPHTPPAREITCDCEECLNHSGETYTCECDNCRQLEEEFDTDELKNNNNHPEDVCKCPECVGQSIDHVEDTVCKCENCVQETEEPVSYHKTVLLNGGSKTWGMSQTLQPDMIHNRRNPGSVSKGLSQTLQHKSVHDHTDQGFSSKGLSQTLQPRNIHDGHDDQRQNGTLLKGLSQTFQNFRPIETYNEKFPFRKGHNSLPKSSNGATNKSKAVTFKNLVVEKTGNVQYFSEESHDYGHEEIDDESYTDGAIINVETEEEEDICVCEDCIEAVGTDHYDHNVKHQNELLEDQLQTSERKLKQKTNDYEAELKDLKKENDKQNQIIQKNLSLGPDAKIEATMQYEISRLTSENLDLRETIDHQADQIRKLKKMLKVYAKKLKEGDASYKSFRPLLSSSCSLSPTTAAEIQAELEKEETKSVENVAHIKHRERNYMGMLEYKKEEENALIKALVLELKPRVVSGMLPGLPAYLLFMCVRHTDYVNDDEKVRSLLTSTINGIKKVVKKHHDDLDRVTLWLANTCRFLHTLKQYSGEKQVMQENTPRQNEHCLRNFDLSEYRSVFSDLAVWIYQTLIKLMEATIQPSIVPAVLEHEAIAGLTGSKPSGLRGRSSSRAEDTPEYSLDSLMKSMNHFVRVLNQHAVDPELIKQIFRQLYYFLGASALNNLLLRKEMCNWSKGMQIRYNLSHMEQWLRDNKLQESAAGMTLEPIIQASQLLQARKTDADVDSVCDMCSKLTTPQIVKILNLYTPVDEFEERVPISFIRKIQQKLKGRELTDNALLMDLKFSYSVTFPFNPSKIALETIDIPDSLHLGQLVSRC